MASDGALRDVQPVGGEMKDWIEMVLGGLLIILGAILMAVLGTAFYVCAVAVVLSPFVLVAWLCVKLFT